MQTLSLHPPFASLPFAFILVVIAFELLSLFLKRPWMRHAALVVLAFAAIAVAAAFYTGYQASESANQTFVVADSEIADPQFYGRLLLFTIIPCAAVGFFSVIAKYSQSLFRAVYLFLLLVSLGLVVTTGYLGGKLVFEHGAGVVAKPQ